MKWIAISGSWRTTPKQLEKDLKSELRAILKAGNGIVTGGALGVDYLVTEQCIKFDPKLSRLRVFLPTKLSIYSKHYQKRAQEGVISQKQGKLLIEQLKYIKITNSQALIESSRFKIVDQASYYSRNQDIIKHASELVAFQVNGSSGTQNAIDYAKKLGKKTKIFSY